MNNWEALVSAFWMQDKIQNNLGHFRVVYLQFIVTSHHNTDDIIILFITAWYTVSTIYNETSNISWINRIRMSKQNRKKLLTISIDINEFISSTQVEVLQYWKYLYVYKVTAGSCYESFTTYETNDQINPIQTIARFYYVKTYLKYLKECHTHTYIQFVTWDTISVVSTKILDKFTLLLRMLNAVTSDISWI